MNNSKIVIDHVSLESEETMDYLPGLRQRETDLIAIIEAIQKVAVTEQWQNLKKRVFDDLTKNLEARLRSESLKAELNEPAIYHLQGQLQWATRYSDLTKLAEVYKVELANIRRNLYGKDN